MAEGWALPGGWGVSFPRPRTLPPPFLLLLFLVSFSFSPRNFVWSRSGPLFPFPPFALSLLFGVNLYRAFPFAAAPRRYCLRAGGARRAGAGRSPPGGTSPFPGERARSVPPVCVRVPLVAQTRPQRPPPLPRCWGY